MEKTIGEKDHAMVCPFPTCPPPGTIRVCGSWVDKSIASATLEALRTLYFITDELRAPEDEGLWRRLLVAREMARKAMAFAEPRK